MQLLLMALLMSALNISLGVYCIWQYSIDVSTGDVFGAVINSILSLLNIVVGIWSVSRLVRIVKKAFADDDDE